MEVLEAELNKIGLLPKELVGCTASLGSRKVENAKLKYVHSFIIEKDGKQMPPGTPAPKSASQGKIKIYPAGHKKAGQRAAWIATANYMQGGGTGRLNECKEQAPGQRTHPHEACVMYKHTSFTVDLLQAPKQGPSYLTTML